MATWVLMGDPKDEVIGYEDLLPELEETGKRVLWKTPQKAQVGDVAVIYLMRPIMAMLATARVTATPQWRDDDEFSWSRGWFAELGDFRMAAQPLQLQDARRSLPGWAWPRGARNAARVPDEFAPPLLERLDDRRRSGSAAASSFVEREIDVPTEPRVAIADPDAVARGLKAHERTVARLAEQVAAAGLTPHRALVGSPAVDLAWRTRDTTVLVEAKTLTRQIRTRYGSCALVLVSCSTTGSQRATHSHRWSPCSPSKGNRRTDSGVSSVENLGSASGGRASHFQEGRGPAAVGRSRERTAMPD